MSENISVLVVEDEVLVRIDLVDQLESRGFRVYEASNADDAVLLLEANSDIQVLFTDIDMPGSMDGLKLAGAVRDRWPPVRIIVTSGHHVADIATLPANSRFFPKPYDLERVVGALRDRTSI